MLRLLLTCLILITSISTRAQLLLGVGAQADFPMMFNEFVGGYHHQTGNPGFRLAACYESEQSNFSPAATVSISTASLPVQWVANEFVLSMDFVHLQAMLFGRLKKEVNNGLLYYGVGIGVSHFSGDGVTIGGSDNVQLQTTLSDSSKYIKMLAPTVAFNIEYIRPIANSNFSYSIGGQLNYFYFYDKTTTYRIDIVDTKGRYFKTSPQLSGHTLNPMLFVNLYYRFGDTRGRY
ncbi:MAG: hypothetical protein R2800_15170 [Flavipsychrobacter sp.]